MVTPGNSEDGRSPSSFFPRLETARSIKTPRKSRDTRSAGELCGKERKTNRRTSTRQFVGLTDGTVVGSPDASDGMVDGGTGGSNFAQAGDQSDVRQAQAEKHNTPNSDDTNNQEVELDEGALLPFECILREAAFGFSDAFQLEPDDADDLHVDVVKSYTPKRPSSNLRLLFQLLAFNSVICVIQIVCGLIANSLALLGDGMLMGVDVITYIVNIYVERKKTISSRHKAKVDQWGGILSLVLLSFTTVWIFIDSLDRLVSPPDDIIVDGRIMFIFTLFNLFVDAILVRNFFKSGADSSSMNMKSAMLHLGADIVRGFGVLVSSCWIWTHAGNGMVADAVCSLFVSMFILFSTVKIGGSLFYKICFDPTDLVDEGAMKQIITVYDENETPQKRQPV